MMKQKDQFLTKENEKTLNKWARECVAYWDKHAGEMIAYAEAEQEKGADMRAWLKRYQISTRTLKRDGSSWREVIKAYYNAKAWDIIGGVDYLARTDEIAPLRCVVVNTEWIRSQVWGWNPRARVFVNYHMAGEGRASGCGYDKQSAAINSALYNNDIFKKAVIIRAIKAKTKGEALPYGIHWDAWGIDANFGGCGVSTFTNILKWLNLGAVRCYGRDNETIAAGDE